MKDETTNSYELTLTPNYVSDWNFNDALRELIQNGTDQEVLDPDNEFQIDYSPKEKVLRLKNRKSVLKINTLYEWDDLDGPRPTMDEYEKQEKEARE